MTDVQVQLYVASQSYWWRLNHRMLTWPEFLLTFGGIILFVIVLHLIQRWWK